MSRGFVRKDMDEIRELKKQGHDAIDRLVKNLGVPRVRVYDMMAEKLGCSEPSAHFQTRYTKRDVEKALKAVLELEAERKALQRRKREETLAEKKLATEKPTPGIVYLGIGKISFGPFVVRLERRL